MDISRFDNWANVPFPIGESLRKEDIDNVKRTLSNSSTYLSTHSNEFKRVQEAAQKKAEENEKRSRELAAESKRLYDRKPAKTSTLSVDKVKEKFQNLESAYKYYKFSYKNNVIYMVAFILSKGTKTRKPDIRLAFTKKHPLDIDDKRVAKEVLTNRVLNSVYDADSLGITNPIGKAGLVNFEIPVEVLKRIWNTIHELRCQYDTPSNYFNKKYQADTNLYGLVPTDMLKLVRLTMPNIVKNKVFTEFSVTTEKDYIKYNKK